MRLNEYVDPRWRYGLKHGNPLQSFKTVIQLYLLCLFLYSLNYCIEEVIKDKIFWRLNLEVLAYESATASNRLIPCSFLSKHWSNCICFICFSIFDLLYQRGYQRQYLCTLNLKCWPMMKLRPETGESIRKILKSSINLYLFCLLLYCST